jgi:tRNA A37 threonylcarbamoyladenosine dehydratase
LGKPGTLLKLLTSSYKRKTLKSKGVTKVIKAVFSAEVPIKESLILTDGRNFKKSAYGTVSYMPATFGNIVAPVAIRDLPSM